MHWKTRSRITSWLLGIVTIGFLLFQWAPMFTMFTLSFAGENGGTTFPMNGVSLHWYQKLWEADLFDDFKPPMLRSFLLALACSATTVVLSVSAAQAMRGRFRGNGLYFYLLLLGLMAPGILVGFGFAILTRLLGIEGAWNTTAYVVHVSWALPFGFLTMLAVFNRFDPRLEEAALTLGANRVTAFRRITWPIILPGVIGTALFGFSLSYDEYARTLFTAGSDGTLPLAVMATLDRQLTPELYAIGTVTTAMSLTAIALCVIGFWLRARALRGRPS